MLHVYYHNKQKERVETNLMTRQERATTGKKNEKTLYFNILNGTFFCFFVFTTLQSPCSGVPPARASQCMWKAGHCLSVRPSGLVSTRWNVGPPHHDDSFPWGPHSGVCVSSDAELGKGLPHQPIVCLPASFQFKDF